MFRFTIRELVLLTLVVAMGVGWWLEADKREAIQSDNSALRDANSALRDANVDLENRLAAIHASLHESFKAELDKFLEPQAQQ